MFDYTRQLIIPKGGRMFAKLSSDETLYGKGKAYATIPVLFASTSDSSLSKTIPLFDSKNVVKVKGISGIDPIYSSLSFDDTLFPITKDLKLTFVISTTNNANTDLANSLTYFRKEYILELPKGTTKARFVEELRHLQSRASVILREERDPVELSVSDSNVQFESAILEEFKLFPDCASIGEWSLEATETVKISVLQNSPGHGTYEYLMANVVLPTTENTRFLSPAMGEQLDPHAVYTQYIVYLKSGLRNIGPGQVVADKSESFTKLILWVHPYVSAGQAFADLGITVDNS